MFIFGRSCPRNTSNLPCIAPPSRELYMTEMLTLKGRTLMITFKAGTICSHFADCCKHLQKLCLCHIPEQGHPGA